MIYNFCDYIIFANTRKESERIKLLSRDAVLPASRLVLLDFLSKIFIASLDGGAVVFVDFAVDCRDFFEAEVYVVDIEGGQVEGVCFLHLAFASVCYFAAEDNAAAAAPMRSLAPMHERCRLAASGKNEGRPRIIGSVWRGGATG